MFLLRRPNPPPRVDIHKVPSCPTVNPEMSAVGRPCSGPNNTAAGGVGFEPTARRADAVKTGAGAQPDGVFGHRQGIDVVAARASLLISTDVWAEFKHAIGFRCVRKYVTNVAAALRDPQPLVRVRPYVQQAVARGWNVVHFTAFVKIQACVTRCDPQGVRTFTGRQSSDTERLNLSVIFSSNLFKPTCVRWSLPKTLEFADPWGAIVGLRCRKGWTPGQSVIGPNVRLGPLDSSERAPRFWLRPRCSLRDLEPELRCSNRAALQRSCIVCCGLTVRCARRPPSACPPTGCRPGMGGWFHQ